LFAGRHDRLSPAKIYRDVTGVNALDRACQQLPGFVDILIENEVALGFPQALHDDLLGGLRGYTPRVVIDETGLQDVSELGAQLDFLGVGHCDLRPWLLNLIDDVKDCLDSHVAVVWVDLDYYILAVGRRISLVRGGKSSFDSRDNYGMGQLSLGGKLSHSQQ
jgi:hypothetical protein